MIQNTKKGCQTGQKPNWNFFKKRKGLWKIRGPKADLTQQEFDSSSTVKGDLLLPWPVWGLGTLPPSPQGDAQACRHQAASSPTHRRGPFVRQPCLVCLGCLPSLTERLFCFKHFSTKTASDNTEFLETLSSLFCKKSSSASALISFK